MPYKHTNTCSVPCSLCPIVNSDENNTEEMKQFCHSTAGTVSRGLDRGLLAEPPVLYTCKIASVILIAPAPLGLPMSRTMSGDKLRTAATRAMSCAY